MYVKIHEGKRDGGIVVAICDENLIGKNLKEGNLNLNITERFYKGDKKTEEEVKKIMEKADNLNLVGKETIKVAIKSGFMLEKNIIKIKGIPHAQVYS